MMSLAQEIESERRSRRFNRLEGIALWLAVLLLLWPLAYGLGRLGGWPPAKSLAITGCAVLTCFLLFVSPRIHGDTPADWGLGSLPGFLRHWRILRAPQRVMLAAILAACTALMLTMNWRHWPEVAHALRIDQPVVLQLRTSLPGALAVHAFGLLLCVLFLGAGLRYDNFLPAFKTALKIALPLCLLILLGAWFQRGTAAFAHAAPDELLLHIFGYVFWGFTQQLLFSGYFCTRLRRGFAPAPPPGRSAARRMGLTALGGLLMSLAGASLLLALMRRSLEVPWSALPYLALVGLPLCAAYLWTLLQEPRRLLVATLCASIFASIHLPSYGLVAATFILGVPLAFVFMQDRNRNLVALSFVHALLGASLYWLFSSDESGQFFIDYHVGPWTKDPATAASLGPPTAVIAGYALILLYSARPDRA